MRAPRYRRLILLDVCQAIDLAERHVQFRRERAFASRSEIPLLSPVGTVGPPE
jgi:hypothetical protein